MPSETILSTVPEKKHPKVLDFISGTLAVIGITLINGHKFIPIPNIAYIIHLVGFGFYLGSYATWLLTVCFYPDLRKETGWYAFTDFKKQNAIASLIGIAGVVCAILAAFVFPPLIIASGWLLVISNIFWVMSEYQKFKVFHEEGKVHEAGQQRKYTAYASFILAGSIISAISFSLMMAFPLYITTISIASLLIIAVLTTIALSFWISSKLHKSPKHENSKKPEAELGKPSDHTLDKSNAISLGMESTPPKHYSTLFIKPIVNQTNKEDFEHKNQPT